MQLPDKTFHLYAGVRDLVYAQSCFMRYKDDESFTLIQCDVTALIPFDIDFHSYYSCSELCNGRLS